MPEEHPRGSSRQQRGDRHTIVSYGDRITQQVCQSITSATLAGFKYVLIGPTSSSISGGGGWGLVADWISIPVRRRTREYRDRQEINKKFAKINSFLLELQANWYDDDYVVFADAFDVLYQKPASMSFLQDAGDKIIFNGERNCWPAYHPHRNIYDCPLMQWGRFC
jgi:hypothetical protein